MVFDSLLPHAECGQNDQRKDAPLFRINGSTNPYYDISFCSCWTIFSDTAELAVSEDMPSEVLKELLTCNGALKVCEFAKESMEKTMKCWIEGVEEKEAEYETKVANLEFSVATLAQERVNNLSRLSYVYSLQFLNPCSGEKESWGHPWSYDCTFCIDYY